MEKPLLSIINAHSSANFTDLSVEFDFRMSLNATIFRSTVAPTWRFNAVVI
jgi:hypothetical protein